MTTDASEPRAPRLTRRRLLRGLFGAGAATAAGVGAVADADPAAAAAGDALVLGQHNTSTTATYLDHPFPGTPTSSDEGALILTSDAFVTLKVSNSSPTTLARAIDVRVSQQARAVGVFAQVNEGRALWGYNNDPIEPAVYAYNTGDGPGLTAGSVGHGPQLFLDPHSVGAGPPTDGAQRVGGLRLDSAGDLWVCIADGTPGTWTRLLREDTPTAGRTIPITPIRVLDTRATGGRAPGGPLVPGQKKGPLKGGEYLTLDLAGVGAVPDDATGVVGNLIALAPNHTGYVRVQPAGAPTAAGGVNFNSGEAAASNAFTSGLNSGSLSIVVGGAATNTTHLAIDIAAFLT